MNNANMKSPATAVQKHRTLTELKPLVPEGDEPLLPLLPEATAGEYYFYRPGFVVA